MSVTNTIRWAGIVSLMVCGCATQGSSPKPGEAFFRQGEALIAAGRFDEGVAQLEKAVAAQPDKLEYRTYLMRQRDLELARMLREAESQRDGAHWPEAEAAYQRALDIDDHNRRAQEGLSQVAVGRKHQAMLSRAEALLDKGDAEGAQILVRGLLAEQSSHVGARALYERIEQQRVEKVMTPPQIKSAFRKPITLEFRDATLKSVFEFISKNAGINFSFDRALQQEARTSILVRNTAIEEAIQILLTTNQLEKKVLNQNTLLIYPAERNAEYQEMFVRSFYLSNIEAKRAMNLVKTVLRSKDVYIDEKLNTLVMRDTPEAIRMAEKLITSQDLAEPEVMLEVEVMEVSRKHLEDIGLQYPTRAAVGVRGATTDASGNKTYTPGQLSFREVQHFNSDLGVFSITDPVIAINLLSQDTDTNLLANPHIRVKNREKAKIHIGDKIPVITSTANSTGFVSESVNYLDVGIKLDVEPTILLNDEVSIKVGMEVSNQTDQVKSSSGTLTYALGTRNANTVLRLKNGETQVLAGLYRDDTQDTINKVPGLSSLPLLGRLFSDKNTDRRKKEIVLLITPRILSNIRPPDATYTVFPSGTDAALGSGGKAAGAVERAPVQAAAPVVAQPVTPQDIQAQQARTDRAFAESVMQPAQSAPEPTPARP